VKLKEEVKEEEEEEKVKEEEEKVKEEEEKREAPELPFLVTNCHVCTFPPQQG